MKRTILAAFTLLLAPTLLIAQPPGGRAGAGSGMGSRMAAMNPARVFVEHRADLGLTDEQVTELTAIADALHETNEPIVEEMRKMRESGRSMRQRSEEDRVAMRTRMETLRTNAEKSHEEASAVLTADQRTKADGLLAKMRPTRRRAGGEARR